jgi:hypothetical protein
LNAICLISAYYLVDSRLYIKGENVCNTV